MRKESTARVPATTPSAAPAPVAGSAPASAPSAPKEKTNRKVLGGPAYDRLVAANASIVPLPSKGKLHSQVTSQLGIIALVGADLITRTSALAKGWDQFDRGYLVGPSASYSACAVNNGSKKAKGTPAFVYARQDGDNIVLMTSDGQDWARPAKGDREQGVYDAALKAATTAFAG